jgi:hypothetical protein
MQTETTTTTESAAVGIDDLPTEIVLDIASLLPLPAGVALASTCRHYRDTILEDETFWRGACARIWPDLPAFVLPSLPACSPLACAVDVSQAPKLKLLQSGETSHPAWRLILKKSRPHLPPPPMILCCLTRRSPSLLPSPLVSESCAFLPFPVVSRFVELPSTTVAVYFYKNKVSCWRSLLSD